MSYCKRLELNNKINKECSNDHLLLGERGGGDEGEGEQQASGSGHDDAETASVRVAPPSGWLSLPLPTSSPWVT